MTIEACKQSTLILNTRALKDTFPVCWQKVITDAESAGEVKKSENFKKKVKSSVYF